AAIADELEHLLAFAQAAADAVEMNDRDLAGRRQDLHKVFGQAELEAADDLCLGAIPHHANRVVRHIRIVAERHAGHFDLLRAPVRQKVARFPVAPRMPAACPSRPQKAQSPTRARACAYRLAERQTPTNCQVTTTTRTDQVSTITAKILVGL